MARSDSGGSDLLLVTGASGFVGSAIAIAARAAAISLPVSAVTTGSLTGCMP